MTTTVALAVKPAVDRSLNEPLLAEIEGVLDGSAIDISELIDRLEMLRVDDDGE